MAVGRLICAQCQYWVRSRDAGTLVRACFGTGDLVDEQCPCLLSDCLSDADQCRKKEGNALSARALWRTQAVKLKACYSLLGLLEQWGCQACQYSSHGQVMPGTSGKVVLEACQDEAGNAADVLLLQELQLVHPGVNRCANSARTQATDRLSKSTCCSSPRAPESHFTQRRCAGGRRMA